MQKDVHAKKIEIALGEAGAEDYEKGIHWTGWDFIHKHFVSARWGKKFHGLFLDCGCGTGLVARNLVSAGREVVGMDISKNMCRVTKQICGVDVIVADCLNLPFRDQAFSVACVSGVLHHFPQQLQSAFLELGRCAKKGICIIEPSATPPHPILRLLLFLQNGYEWVLRRTAYKHSRTKYSHSIFEDPLDPEKLRKLFEKQDFQVSEMIFFNKIPYFPPFSVTCLPSKLRKHLIRSMISSTRGTDVEIIAIHG